VSERNKVSLFTLVPIVHTRYCTFAALKKDCWRFSWRTGKWRARETELTLRAATETRFYVYTIQAAFLHNILKLTARE